MEYFKHVMDIYLNKLFHDVTTAKWWHCLFSISNSLIQTSSTRNTETWKLRLDTTLAPGSLRSDFHFFWFISRFINAMNSMGLSPGKHRYLGTHNILPTSWWDILTSVRLFHKTLGCQAKDPLKAARGSVSSAWTRSYDHLNPLFLELPQRAEGLEGLLYLDK